MAAAREVPGESVADRRKHHVRLLDMLVHLGDAVSQVRRVHAKLGEFHRYETRFFKRRVMADLETLRQAAEGFGEALIGFGALSRRVGAMRGPFLREWGLDLKSWCRRPPLVANLFPLAVPRVLHVEGLLPYTLKVPLAPPPGADPFDPEARFRLLRRVPVQDPDWRKGYLDAARDDMSFAECDMSDGPALRAQFETAGRSLDTIAWAARTIHACIQADFPQGELYPFGSLG